MVSNCVNRTIRFWFQPTKISLSVKLSGNDREEVYSLGHLRGKCEVVCVPKCITNLMQSENAQTFPFSITGVNADLMRRFFFKFKLFYFYSINVKNLNKILNKARDKTTTKYLKGL